MECRVNLLFRNFCALHFASSRLEFPSFGELPLWFPYVSIKNYLYTVRAVNRAHFNKIILLLSGYFRVQYESVLHCVNVFVMCEQLVKLL